MPSNRQKWLRTHAACERLSRFLGTASQRYTQALQPSADALGRALALPDEATSIFAEEVVRGTAVAPLAQLLAVLDPLVRDLVGLAGWQVISPGTGEPPAARAPLALSCFGPQRLRPQAEGADSQACIRLHLFVVMRCSVEMFRLCALCSICCSILCYLCLLQQKQHALR